MSTVSYSFDANFDVDVPLLIVGAGAAGLCAALAAKEAGIAPLVIERDTVPGGSTARQHSSGRRHPADARAQGDAQQISVRPVPPP